jgi:hypothetical protein
LNALLMAGTAVVQAANRGKFMRSGRWFTFAAVALCLGGHAAAQSAPRMEEVPLRGAGEGEGPYRKLVIRGATMIRGNGAPPVGPVDIVVEGNRISGVLPAGTPGLPLKPGRNPKDADREIDATGQWVLPGMIDTHGHNGDTDKAANASYGYKLWLAHGVTSVRGVSFYWGDVGQTMRDRANGASGRIVAPRLFPYVVLGDWPNGDVDTADRAR